MLKQERQRLIRQLIEEQGQVSVAELARRFGVVEMTIRRDLEELGAQGGIERTHGGAVLPLQRRNRSEPPVLERMGEETAAKQRIGQAVAAMIGSGETVFIGSGTTALAVAEALPGTRGLTVITNALTVVNLLCDSSDIDMVVIGGFLRRSELSFIGHIAETTLDDLRVDKVIIGMRGVDPRYGLTSDHLEELRTDQAILRLSDTIIVVADHTKLGHVAASRTAPITAASLIVTDRAAPPEIVDAIRKAGVEVLLV